MTNIINSVKNRVKEIARLNQSVIDMQSMSKSEIIEHYKRLALDNSRLKNENRRYVVSKKKVSKNEHMTTRYNRAKRTKRSALLIFLESKIAESRYTRKQLIDLALFHFDSAYAISTISTYIADSQNDKYFQNVFNRKVKKTNDILHFVDTKVKSKQELLAERNQSMIQAMYQD